MILYDKEARIYDIINQGIPYILESRMIESILDKTFEKTLLDVACGTGEMLKYIESDKYKCKGMDCSEKMLEIAKIKNIQKDFFSGDMKKFNINQKVSVISCLGSAIQYNLSLMELESTIRNFVKNCTDYVVFDIRYCLDKWIDGYQKDKTYENDKYKIRETWTSKRIDKFSIWEPIYEIFDKKKGEKFIEKDYHKIRLFSISEVENILKNNDIRYEIIDLKLNPTKNIKEQFYFLLQLR